MSISAESQGLWCAASKIKFVRAPMMENKFQVAINAGGAGSGPRPPPPTRAAAAAVDWHLPCAR